MRNTRKSGQILQSKKRPRPTLNLRSGRGSRTNSNTFHQIPARVIEAHSACAVWVPVPDPRSAQLIQPGAAAAVITVPSKAWLALEQGYVVHDERRHTYQLTPGSHRAVGGQCLTDRCLFTVSD